MEDRREKVRKLELSPGRYSASELQNRKNGRKKFIKKVIQEIFQN